MTRISLHRPQRTKSSLLCLPKSLHSSFWKSFTQLLSSYFLESFLVNINVDDLSSLSVNKLKYLAKYRNPPQYPVPWKCQIFKTRYLVIGTFVLSLYIAFKNIHFNNNKKIFNFTLFIFFFDTFLFFLKIYFSFIYLFIFFHFFIFFLPFLFSFSFCN